MSSVPRAFSELLAGGDYCSVLCGVFLVWPLGEPGHDQFEGSGRMGLPNTPPPPPPPSQKKKSTRQPVAENMDQRGKASRWSRSRCGSPPPSVIRQREGEPQRRDEPGAFGYMLALAAPDDDNESLGLCFSSDAAPRPTFAAGRKVTCLTQATGPPPKIAGTVAGAGNSVGLSESRDENTDSRDSGRAVAAGFKSM
ncbi:hypothetical protein F5X96DRAFT_668395 [Biscogniauxia mediterranea]|nr:hypothetical protein F5X96DRAFT_668395 [Biscogniauxia mediterranea]